MDEAFGLRYREILAAFCNSRSEEELETVRALTRELVAASVASDEIVALHEAAVKDSAVLQGPANAMTVQRFLLEVMIAYGVAYSAIAERLLADARTAAGLAVTRAGDLDRLDRERLELLAGVSHELGTPLTVVKGNVAAIRRFLEANHNWPEELSQGEDDVEFAIERMLALREDLLAASRNEQRELEMVPLHLVHCLQRVVRWAQVGASEKGVQLVHEYPPDIGYVLGDEGAVQSVFSNLLSNALRYTLAGGAIRVTTANKDSGVSVEVRDTGIGISEADQQRIFERFYRTPEAQKVATFGLGLGLAITRDLVSAMGGTIEVESSPRLGSMFRVTLPFADMSEVED